MNFQQDNVGKRVRKVGCDQADRQVEGTHSVDRTSPEVVHRQRDSDLDLYAVRKNTYGVTSLLNAKRLLMMYGDRLLVVHDTDGRVSDLRVADEYGIWTTGTTTLLGWMSDTAEHLIEKARRGGLDRVAPQHWISTLNALNKLQEPRTLEGIRKEAATALDQLRRDGLPGKAGQVVACPPHALDAKLQYMGVANGVVDLHAGRLLPPEEGRAALLTVRTHVEFDLTATHAAIQGLFAHLPPEVEAWWWRVFGFHLRGHPSRRFYVVVGPKSGGKSTVANALERCLGPYMRRPGDTALAPTRGRNAGLSPEMECFTAPVRLAIFDEVANLRVAGPLLKRLSGDGGQTFRPLYQAERTERVTATVMFICNEGSEPHLQLRDEALADRFRRLPYPTLPNPDPGMKDTVETEEFARALLARLVMAAASATARVPPEEPDDVKRYTLERVLGNVDKIGEFAERIVQGAGVLTVAELWAGWCEHNRETGNPDRIQETGGISKRNLSGVLREYMLGKLREPKVTTVNGKNVRGWRGWTMKPVAHPQSEAGEIRGGVASVPAGSPRERFHPGKFLDIAGDKTQPPDRRERAVKWARFLERGTGIVLRKTAEEFLDSVGDPPDNGTLTGSETGDLFDGIDGDDVGEQLPRGYDGRTGSVTDRQIEESPGKGNAAGASVRGAA
ncbi:MAG: hypothetical protein OXE53_07270 [Deltaproteobacteria bacterium]|nr:hypothetical protein [Deltaproteobacteria bacterium]